MAFKTRAQLVEDVNAKIRSGASDTSAENFRALFLDMLDSVLADANISSTAIGQELIRMAQGWVDRPRACVDVRDYGEINWDGVTDNTPLVKTAIAAAAGRGINTVYLPGFCPTTPGAGCLVDLGVSNSVLVLPYGMSFVGDGYNSVLKTTYNGALLVPGNDSQITGLRLIGSGRGVAAKPLQSLIFCYEKKRVLIDRIWAEGCAGDGSNQYYGGAISVSKTQTGVAPSHEGVKISNFNVVDSTLGIYLGKDGEYCSVTTGTVSRCTTGSKLTAGNYSIGNVHFPACGIGMDIALNTNSGHGVATGCTFNHCTTAAFRITGLGNLYGHTFSGCMFYHSAASITDSDGVKFIGCDIVGSTTSPQAWNFTNSKKTLFLGCRLPQGATPGAIVFNTVVGAGGEAPTIVNCLDF